jgi:hypothetical protein
LAEYQAALNYNNCDEAWTILNSLYWSIQAGIDALTANTTFTPIQIATKAKLDAVVAIRNPAVETELAELEKRYTAAVATAAGGNFFTATREMNAIAPKCDRLLPIAQAFAGYLAARDPADAKLKEAEAHAQVAAIQTMITRLRGKFDNAAKLAIEGDPATATIMMQEILPAAEDAIANADGSAIFEGIAEAIGDSASDDGPSFLHIAAAKKAYDWQADKDNASVAQTHLDEAKIKLALAEAGSTPPKDAKEALQAAMDAVTLAGQIISQHLLLLEAVAMARTKIALLKAHPQKSYISTQIVALDAAVDAVETSAKDSASIARASTDLEAAMDNFHDLRAKADAHVTYVDLRAKPEIVPRLAALEAHDHSYAIQTNIDAMRQKIAEATTKSQAFDPLAAVALLEQVEAIGLSSLVLADMRANTPPSVSDIQDILSRPNGQAELDAMMDALEPDAKRAVLRVAFEARFGCQLRNFQTTVTAADGSETFVTPIADNALKGPNIERFYEIMSELPSGATLDNDSMRQFTMVETGQGSFYDGETKDVVMREGDAALSSAYTFGSEFQVGEVEEDCEPANDDPVSFFSWNTLHEVGHAVDDQHGFMKKNCTGAAFGSWTEYGGSIQPIAAAAARKFKYDPTYIGQILAGNANAALPALPSDNSCTEEEWESRRIAFTAWNASVREGRNPWSSQATAKAIAIDGVVYQESYAGTWTSYSLDARSKGISSYQFRAPGEWFSELYAAYHSGKLKPSHPAISWLEAL